MYDQSWVLTARWEFQLVYFSHCGWASVSVAAGGVGSLDIDTRYSMRTARISQVCNASSLYFHLQYGIPPRLV